MVELYLDVKVNRQYRSGLGRYWQTNYYLFLITAAAAAISGAAGRTSAASAANRLR